MADRTVYTLNDVSADCVAVGDWMFNAVANNFEQEFCVWNNQYVVVENGNTYPTCVQYSAGVEDDCDQDNLICGEMVGDQQGWPNQVKNQMTLALERADYKHPSCPTIQSDCRELSSYWLDLLEGTDVSRVNVCASQNELQEGQVRVVEHDRYVDTCVGWSEQARQSCPNDRDFICAGNAGGSLVYGWPGQIAATARAAMGTAGYRHPQCAGLLP